MARWIAALLLILSALAVGRHVLPTATPARPIDESVETGRRLRLPTTPPPQAWLERATHLPLATLPRRAGGVPFEDDARPDTALTTTACCGAGVTAVWTAACRGADASHDPACSRAVGNRGPPAPRS